MATAATTNNFFSSAVGRAVTKIVTTAVLWAIAKLYKDPTVVAWVLGIGGLNTILSLARDVVDSSIPNLP